jgi:hypothetical protein
MGGWEREIHKREATHRACHLGTLTRARNAVRCARQKKEVRTKARASRGGTHAPKHETGGGNPCDPQTLVSKTLVLLCDPTRREREDSLSLSL